MRWIPMLSYLFVLGGCANGYQQFYHAYPGITPEAISKNRTAPAPETPQVEHIPSANASVFENYEKLGYVPIGYSSFNAGRRQPDSYAVDQGKKVGADLVVIVNPQYTGTETASIPITTPTTSSAYSSGTATAYGPYGTVNAYGSSITQYYGSRTTYMPLIIHREDFGAVYFIKRHFELGAMFRDLNDGERQNLQTNKGVVIEVVVNDSPAFNADLLKGDVIKSVNGQPVLDAKGFSSLLMSERGRTVELTILRGDKQLEKSVQLSK